jgi:hypothetical protein
MTTNLRLTSALSKLSSESIEFAELPNDRNDSDSWNAIKRLAGLDDLEVIALKNERFPANTAAAGN